MVVVVEVQLLLLMLELKLWLVFVQIVIWCKIIVVCMLIQDVYICFMDWVDLIFGIGLVGMGKMFLVVVYVVVFLECGDVVCLILLCLVVEVGEWLGFLFGEMKDKVDFYLWLIYDVFYEMMLVEKVDCGLQFGMIEVVLLVFM